jgi:hypothetical protein
VKGWISDVFHTIWALFYWNARKTVFRLRGRRGLAPCHNPSDSGAAMKTGCEACMGWNKPARFSRVCPLLRQHENGSWVCSVDAADVRPFWGRVFAYSGTTLLGCYVILAALAYGGMHYIGYNVTVRQLVWPPAWAELRGVRADLFIEQARAKYALGEVREAIQSLTIAHELNPAHYQVAMMLAQFHQAGSPTQTDRLYRQQMELHPERRGDIARAWFQSILAHGRMADLAELAEQQLKLEPAQAAAWSNALLFATRHGVDPKILSEVVASPDIPVAARQLLDMALKSRLVSPIEARKLLIETPLISDFPYDLVFRINELIRRGFPREAFAVLAQTRKQLPGRDVAKLIFASYAELQNRERLVQEFSALLAPQRNLSAPECTLLAVHLITYPDPELLSMLCDSLNRVPLEPANSWMESAIAVFCAAGVQNDAGQMERIRTLIQRNFNITPVGLDTLELFFQGKIAIKRIERLLPGLSPLSLELNYALLDRYLPEIKSP